MARKRDLKLKAYVSKANGKHRWRFFSGNGEQLAKSPRGYKTKDAMIVDLTVILGRDHDAEVYAGRDGDWWWRFSIPDQDKPGKMKKVAMSSQGVVDKAHCKRMSDLLLDAEVV